MLDVALLGTGGMMPLPERFLASMICRYNGKSLLIDCGEGTQVSLKMLGWGFKSIEVICFTHYHGDHISGLPGLLLTMGNAGREDPLHMVGPSGLARVVSSLRVIVPDIPFPVVFHEWDAPREGTVIGGFPVSSLPLRHGAPCLAYHIKIPRIGRFDPDKARALNLPVHKWSLLQKNGFAEHEGRKFTGAMVLGPERKGIKLSYCTDTRPVKNLPEFIMDSDLFICEGLYGEDEKKEKAIEHRHMIFSEAADIAREGRAKELWLTHFSPAMPKPKEHLPAASRIFPNTVIGRDRMTKQILFDNE